MSYCVALQTTGGLLFMADTRTNAGVDNVSVFRKLFTWTRPGERVLVALTSGNLATTQAVMSLLDERATSPTHVHPSILEASSMFQVARLVGETLREVIQTSTTGGQAAESTFAASIILGGRSPACRRVCF